MKQEDENEPLVSNLEPGFLTRIDFCARKEPSHILPLKSVENRKNKKQNHRLGMSYAKMF